MLAVDLHQHIWPESVLRTLEGRVAAPRAVWRRGAWDVRLRHEPSFLVQPEEHDPVRRQDELRAAGVDRAVVALSSPVGAEAVPGVVEAWSSAAAVLPRSLGWWAAVPPGAPVAEQVAVVRDAVGDGAAGLCLPATALRSAESAEAALPLLHELDRHGVPLFVHPGEADGGAADPGWWASATCYVGQMHAAWHAFHLVVRPALAGLRVVFALLAGLAPLHLERALERGAPLDGATDDQRCFYDTSSYGPRAVVAMARVLGAGQFVYGSDHPTAAAAPVERGAVASALGGATAAVVCRENAARALGYAWIPG
jgi:predicted TIM-barrel fold metal-dependent hydrolase